MIAAPSKICSHCAQSKPHSEFYRRRISPDGLGYLCKPCAKEKTAAWREAHREQHRAYSTKWQKEHKERANARSAKWRTENKPRRAEIANSWAKRNDDYRRMKIAERRARLVTPLWANRRKIAEIYESASQLQKMTGTQYHVDHVVPVHSDVVCGLHVETNLQVIPARDNVLKRNLFWPDMP